MTQLIRPLSIVLFLNCLLLSRAQICISTASTDGIGRNFISPIIVSFSIRTDLNFNEGDWPGFQRFSEIEPGFRRFKYILSAAEHVKLLYEYAALQQVLQPMSQLIKRQMQLGGMSSLQGHLLTADSLASQQATQTHKMYEAALKATRSRIPQIETAMLDLMNGTDMTVYTYQKSGDQRSSQHKNPISMLQLVQNQPSNSRLAPSNAKSKDADQAQMNYKMIQDSFKSRF